jgi:predicted RNA-binding Zn-ribbon protein involved in translation (DUF1610 family)
LGPTVVVDGRYFRHVTIADVPHIIEQARKVRKRPAADDERVFPLAVQCPKCRESLMDSKNVLDGLQSIKLWATCNGKKCNAYLSSFYGSDQVRLTSDIADGALVSLSCPKCGKDLSADAYCPECGAKMAMMSVEGRAELYVCPRRGCPGHQLDLVTQELKPKTKPKHKREHKQKQKRKPEKKAKGLKSRQKPKSKLKPNLKARKKKKA